MAVAGEKKKRTDICGNLLRAMSLIVACIVNAFVCQPLNFITIVNDVKSFYNVSQTQVELMLSMSVVGKYCGLPAGCYLRRCGTTCTLITGTLMTTGTTLLLYSSTFSPLFYHKHFWLIVVYSFCLGLASVLLYLSVSSVNIRNFCHRHTGKVIGLTQCFGCCGASVVTILYVKYFESTKDIRNFWLVQAAIGLGINSLGVIFLRNYSHLVVECDTETTPLRGKDGTKSTQNGTDEESEGAKGLALIKSLNFHLLAWAFLMNGAICNLVRMNTAVFLKSLNMEHLMTFLTGASPISAAVAQMVVGCLSDFYIKAVPRVFYIASFTWYSVVILSLSAFYGDFQPVIINLSYVVDSIYELSYFAIVSDMFGEKNVGIIMGIILQGCSLATVPVMLWFGSSYDHKVNSMGEECYGPECFRTIFLVSAITLTFAASCMTYLAIRERKWRKSSNAK